MNNSLEDKIAAFIRKLIELSRLDITVSISIEEDRANVQLSGRDVPMLLAHNAELLDAFEYITNRAFGRELGQGVRIHFDSDGYRSAREAELRLMALKAAEKVKLTKTSFSFEPMSASERRIIHTTLIDDASVRTESQGDGMNRKVTIFPV